MAGSCTLKHFCWYYAHSKCLLVSGLTLSHGEGQLRLAQWVSGGGLVSTLGRWCWRMNYRGCLPGAGAVPARQPAGGVSRRAAVRIRGWGAWFMWRTSKNQNIHDLTKWQSGQGGWCGALEEPGPLAGGEDKTGLRGLFINEVSHGGHEEAQQNFQMDRFHQQVQFWQHGGACQTRSHNLVSRVTGVISPCGLDSRDWTRRGWCGQCGRWSQWGLRGQWGRLG